MKGTLSTSAVARLLGVAVGSIANWIDRGQLKAGRTPGGHRRVAVADLVDLLRRQKLPIPPELKPSPPRILIVDDEESFTHWLAGEIKAEHPDYDVLEAHDGFAAGELVGSLKPHVVFLDLRMPGMDGFEVCQQIKSKEETKDTVVIAMTAYPSEKSKRRILDCGAQTYMVKPLEIDVAMKELEACLARRL